jgi:hypothetical protein
MVFLVTISGNPLALSVGPMTLVEIVAEAESTLSGSTRIFANLGTMPARIETISSGPSPYPLRVLPESDLGMPPLDVAGSANAIGLVVKRAASRRMKVS